MQRVALYCKFITLPEQYWLFHLEKQTALDRGQTDHFTILANLNPNPWHMIILSELWSWPVHKQNINIKGQWVEKLEWNGRTDTTDRITFPPMHLVVDTEPV